MSNPRPRRVARVAVTRVGPTGFVPVVGIMGSEK
jgi:hypothetical protein